MDAVLLSRIQFGLTVGFHFLFPPLTIGLAWIIYFMQRRFHQTGEMLYRQMSRFWVRILAVTFAIGVASGIVMEFQFGTNWAEYSRYVGDIFGAPLAAEGILAFFLESAFIGVLIWGENRVSPTLYRLSSLLVAIGATLSAFWIIVANSWMQTPAGYHIAGGRAELTSFIQAVFNPSTLPRYLHTIDASIITGALFVVGISAWLLLKNHHKKMARESLRIGLIVAVIACVLQLFLGHYHAVQVADTQPAKFAAMEGLFESEQGAPLLLFGLIDPENRTVNSKIEVPYFLSLFVAADPNYEVQGLNSFPETDWPPIKATFYTFHPMTWLGGAFILFTLWGVWLLRRGTIYNHRLFQRLAVIVIPFPFIVNELGWITAEVGRQPWIVYGLLRTADAASVNVPAAQILASLVMFSLIYILLLGLWIFLITRHLKPGIDENISGKEAASL